MPRLGPIKHKDLIRYLRQLGFEGPYSGRKHQFMIKGNITIFCVVKAPAFKRGDETTLNFCGSMPQKIKNELDISSVGAVTLEVVKRYIEEQKGK